KIECGFHLGREHGFDPINRRRGGRGGLVEEGRERLYFIFRLNLLDVVQIRGIQELRAADYADQFSFRMDDFRDAFRRLSGPARSSHQESAASIPRGARAYVVEVEGVEIEHLENEVTVLFDRRSREHDGLGAQVQTEKG